MTNTHGNTFDSRYHENSGAITKLLCFLKLTEIHFLLKVTLFLFKIVVVKFCIYSTRKATQSRKAGATTSTLGWDPSPSQHYHGSFGQDMYPFIHLVSVRECKEKVSCLRKTTIQCRDEPMSIEPPTLRSSNEKSPTR